MRYIQVIRNEGKPMISEQELKEMSTQFKELEKNIKEYSMIIIYRHQSPDFDALGAQMGLYHWIRFNYPEKEVHYVGDRHPDLMPVLFPIPEELDETVYRRKHLAICVDVSNRSRIAKDHISLAEKVIKIDHHPLPSEGEGYGDYLIVHPDRPAASELVALFALSRSRKLHINKEAATALYCGIVGDTGKFTYQDTDGATLRIAGDLADFGVDINSLILEMYSLDQRRLEILKYCLNNYHITEKGTAYYVFDKEEMNKLNMTVDQGNLHINVFRDLKGVKAAMSVTWDEGKSHYRVSLRSAKIHIAPVANQFGGGGHDFAAGCHIKDLSELPQILEAVDNL